MPVGDEPSWTWSPVWQARADTAAGTVVVSAGGDHVYRIDGLDRDAATAVEQSGELSLATLVERADPELGPFTAMANELGGTMRAHLRSLVREGRVREDPSGMHWTTA